MIDRATDILGLVDVQPTFMPGGELPVTDGDAVVPVINRLLPRFDHAFASSAAAMRRMDVQAVEQQQKMPYKDVANRVPDSNDPKAMMDDACAAIQEALAPR